MNEFKRILFPVDLSDVSANIAPWVLMVAKKFDAEVHLLFVARSLDHFVGVYVTPTYIQSFENEVIKGAEKKIEEFTKAYFEGYPSYKSRVVLGDTTEEILKYVKSENMDLVIMGTHGRKGIDRVVFGSVADRVVKTSSVPVLTINPYRIAAS